MTGVAAAPTSHPNLHWSAPGCPDGVGERVRLTEDAAYAFDLSR